MNESRPELPRLPYMVCKPETGHVLQWVEADLIAWRDACIAADRAARAETVKPNWLRDEFEAFMLTRESPSGAKKKLSQREGNEYLHPHVARHWFTWQHASRQALRTQSGSPPAVPDGWKLVPIEPTQEMLIAGVKEQHGSAVYRAVAASGCSTYEGEQYANYAAMLDAAPPLPLKEQV